MTTFYQLHFLTAYGPANLNRDDLGRPKTANFGGIQRLRVSSQSLKRAWRTSEVFESKLRARIGKRTKRLGELIYTHLKDGGYDDKAALDSAVRIAGQFGKSETAQNKNPLHIAQLAHISPAEERAALALADRILSGKPLAKKGSGKNGKEQDTDLLTLLGTGEGTADIALFGRMLADTPNSNVDAASQVAHAISVHGVTVEDDYFTAVDDLNDGSEDAGAAHLGQNEFASAVLYHYVCINADLLRKNCGDGELATQTLRTFVETALTVAPTGKQNSFGSRARASYALLECGSQQPRSLCAAFLSPIGSGSQLQEAISALGLTRDGFDKVYGPCAERSVSFDAVSGEGSLADLLAAIEVA